MLFKNCQRGNQQQGYTGRQRYNYGGAGTGYGDDEVKLAESELSVQPSKQVEQGSAQTASEHFNILAINHEGGREQFGIILTEQNDVKSSQQSSMWTSLILRGWKREF